MPLKHVLLALLVVLIWGVNFIFVKLGLDEFSPLFLCALRFFLASVPAIFFVKLPAVPFKIVVSYGLVMFALQFAFLFIGMNAGMTAGMASLIIQVQVFFSMFFAAVTLGEKPTKKQLLGAFISFTGILLVAMHFNDQGLSITGFFFILAAAASWGVGNLITKQLSSVNMIALVVWGCFIACIPMFVLALWIEGPGSLRYSYQHLSWVGMGALFYIVCISTWIGYGVWNWLISRHPVGHVVPFVLLIPIIAMLSSMWILHEPFEWWKGTAGVLVVFGLYINLLNPRRNISEGH
jgi:O-acetylserine/cysteine efflux transporter